jgi:GTPase SAR1 family protein
MGIMLVYDITSTKTFDNIAKWLRNIDEVQYISLSCNNLVIYNFCLTYPYCFVWMCVKHANEDVEKMILGNKCDVEDKRAVSKEKGEMVSSQ